MGRQTRQQRRAASAAREGAGEKLAGARPRPRQAEAPAEAEPVRATAVVRRRRFLGGLRTYVEESWAELQKVEWPRQRQLVTGTTVVIIACLVVGVYLYAADEAFKRLVVNVFLGQ
ncbi:MAG TPA: preprotein translocase subunit SecE [Polyangiaceae bacterium]|nr:preprotein translocase subunit SecE [Polyangiaceae bacterium]